MHFKFNHSNTLFSKQEKADKFESIESKILSKGKVKLLQNSEPAERLETLFILHTPEAKSFRKSIKSWRARKMVLVN